MQLKGPAHEHEKTLAKHRVAKIPVATQVQKNRNSELFPLRDSKKNHIFFHAAVLQLRKKKHRCMYNTYCLPNYQILPVFKLLINY